MKIPIYLAATLVCAAPVWAQPDPIVKPVNGLPFRLVSPADAEKLAALKPIKLKLDNVTVAWALEELQLQSGIELDLENLQYSKKTLAKKVSLNIETRSFNRAFDEIMDEAGLKATLQRYDQNRPFRVDFNRGGGGGEEVKQGLISSQNLFSARLLTLNTTFSKTIDLSDAKAPARTERNNLTAYLALSPDLSLPRIGAARARLTRAEDETGASLLVATDENNRRFSAYGFYSNNEGRSTANLMMRPPAPDSKTLRRLEGVVVYALVAKTEKWEVPDLLSQPEWTHEFKNGEQTFFASVKATPVKGNAGGVALTIEITSNQTTNNEEVAPPLLAVAPVLAALKVQDANGATLRGNNGYDSGGNNGKLKFTTTFYQSGAEYEGNRAKELATPLKMIFDAPVDVVQTEAPFSFENVPLP